MQGRSLIYYDGSQMQLYDNNKKVDVKTNKKPAEREFMDGASSREVHLPRTVPADDNTIPQSIQFVKYLTKRRETKKTAAWKRRSGDPPGNRTRDTMIKSHVLYRLS